MYKDGEEFRSTSVHLELDMHTKDGFVPSLKDVVEMVKPYGELIGVQQITTNDWGRKF